MSGHIYLASCERKHDFRRAGTQAGGEMTGATTRCHLLRQGGVKCGVGWTAISRICTTFFHLCYDQVEAVVSGRMKK